MATVLETYKGKQSGDQLTAETWNNCISAIETGITKFDRNLEVSSKGNFTVKGTKNVNIEPAYTVGGDANDGDIALKPGDDIQFCSHHRPADKQDEVLLKVIDGNDKPVKFQINSSELTFTTKGKDADADKSEEILNLNISTGKSTGNKRGYIKLRARAIDLRCEEHGGIALQPKGKDSSGHINKIKFEHGGGDGLEFGTFNTEHTSLFTEDYRFNKNGTIKLATRVSVPRATTGDKKYDAEDETTWYTYTKQTDDTYDVIDGNDPTATWEDLIKFAHWAKTHNFGPWAPTT